jgi:hypothetical protein
VAAARGEERRRRRARRGEGEGEGGQGFRARLILAEPAALACLQRFIAAQLGSATGRRVVGCYYWAGPTVCRAETAHGDERMSRRGRV